MKTNEIVTQNFTTHLLRDFWVTIPADWQSKVISDRSRYFIGPNVGSSHVTLLVYSALKSETDTRTYKNFYDKHMASVQHKKNFRLERESSLKSSGFKAKGQYCNYVFYEEKIDTEVRIQCIFSEGPEQLIMLNYYIPLLKNAEEHIKMSEKILNSFRLKQE